MYFQEASEPIPDYLMLRASQVEARSLTPGMSPTLALWCQSANTDSNNGTWFQPPGSTAVSSMDIDSPNDEPYQMITCYRQVGLVRDIGLASTMRPADTIITSDIHWTSYRMLHDTIIQSFYEIACRLQKSILLM